MSGDVEKELFRGKTTWCFPTGIMDCRLTNGKEKGLDTLLDDLRQEIKSRQTRFKQRS